MASDSTSVSSAERPGPTVFVLYGGTGDLAKRMVLPAFYTLAKEGLLPADWALIGNGRGDVAHEDFRKHVHDVLTEFGPAPDEHWDAFAERVYFAGGGFNTDDPGSLLDVIEHVRSRVGHDSKLVHYFAVPPTAFIELTKALGEHDLADGARVIYEKPFGTSQAAFTELDKVVHSVLDESQVYRIDHFLGKEATQNLHVLRFANQIFSSIWCADNVSAVQIDVPERLGVTDRAEFYDHTGATLDMLVTHLFQVAAEVAMDTPASMSAHDLQAAREEAIGSFRPLDPSEVVLGQFEGYRDLDGVAEDSEVDTFVAARLWIDNERWRGVPFLLRTGKRLHTSAQRVSLILKNPQGPFGDELSTAGPRVLTFSMAGDGAITLSMLVKQPGPAVELQDGELNLALASLPDAEPLPPYVRLIHDGLMGDRSLFTRPDGLASVWEVAAPLLDKRPAVQPYRPGSWGPDAAAELAEPYGWLLGG